MLESWAGTERHKLSHSSTYTEGGPRLFWSEQKETCFAKKKNLKRFKKFDWWREKAFTTVGFSL